MSTALVWVVPVCLGGVWGIGAAAVVAYDRYAADAMGMWPI